MINKQLDLEERLDYADRLIQEMGKEIIAWTPSHKKQQAIELLRMHTDIIRGKKIDAK